MKELADTDEAITEATSAQESSTQLIQTGSPQQEDDEALLSIDTT